MSRCASSNRQIQMPAMRLAAFTVLSILASAFLASAAHSEPSEPTGIPAPMSIDEVGRGSLLFPTAKPGRFLPAPVVTTEVDMQVSGMVARVSVRQQFYNPTNSWLEGIYAFPLPENAAVDHMRLRIGDEVIEARIRERKAAKKLYAKARRDGRRAALIEQHRPNIFTNTVANIGPKDSVMVELSYQQTLRYDQGRFRLRFPMVVAPRYTPGPVTMARTGGTGWAAETAEDTEAIVSPVLRPEEGAINPVVLNIKLDAGFPLDALESPYHKIKVSNRKNGKADITLDDGAVAQWLVEWGTKNDLIRRGVRVERIHVGDVLTITLAPSRRLAHVGYLTSAVLPDGSTIRDCGYAAFREALVNSTEFACPDATGPE